MAACLMIALVFSCVMPVSAQEPQPGEVSGRSVGAGLLSLFVWSGLGQWLINDQPADKNWTHAALDLVTCRLFGLWSCYDGVVDRDGGYWKGRI